MKAKMGIGDGASRPVFFGPGEAPVQEDNYLEDLKVSLQAGSFSDARILAAKKLCKAGLLVDHKDIRAIQYCIRSKTVEWIIVYFDSFYAMLDRGGKINYVNHVADR